MRIRNHDRRGHTLFELLLALGLSLVLLVAVYSALDMHWRYSEAGKQRTERMQLGRALLERIQSDIRDIVFSEIAVSDFHGKLTTIQLGGDNSAGMPAVAEVNLAHPVGLVGDARHLLLQVSKPSRDQIWGEPIEHPQDLRFVSWQVVQRQSGTIRDQASWNNSELHREGSGLTRREADPLAYAAINTSADQGVAAEEGKLLAPEVRAIRFRYFDGQFWHETWNSQLKRRLPRAVSVEINFRPGDLVWDDVDGGNTVPGFRQIVFVPLSEPTLITRES